MKPSQRLQTLAATFPRLRIDYLLITYLPNIRYLCGFTGSAGALLVGGGEPVFFTDGRYTEQAHEEVIGARVLIEKKPPSHAAAEWLKRKRPGKLGVEGGHVTVTAEARLRALLPKPWRLRPTSGAVERHRMIKDAAEAELLRKAVNLGSSLFTPMLKAIRPGILETAVAAELEYAARRAGASGMAFDTIVA